ncbi:MAG: LysE family translocator [Hyphomicrobiales bacterium]|uniref:LysE family translocator n=1 Tax=Rhabdaerophilum calidifontis TaxID=2604328 RepID=UPI001238E1D0|nr:LysE family translocator [Rhabdaerophilum calidifontis]MCA1952771.1 LysE family translocator [Hyphomicrobiales bacterium]MCA1998332.1 LysE family translocator [Hyphomicrobiales bacterium]
MPTETVLAFLAFAFASSVTPGPNNMMLVASGVNFGLRRTLSHVAGINVGFPVMLLLSGLGLGQVFHRYPALYGAMKVIGIAYMLWLAWKIARSGPVGEGREIGSPMRFWQAAAFQWVNPKAWAMVVGAIAAYTVPENYLGSLLMITVLYALTGAPGSLIWAAFGAAMRGFLSDPGKVRWFNIAMALLLVASLWPALAELLAP